jgi:hypothetical protein
LQATNTLAYFDIFNPTTVFLSKYRKEIKRFSLNKAPFFRPRLYSIKHSIVN